MHDIYLRHRQFTSQHPNKANHCSVPYLAYRCRQLPRFTGPLHELTFENGRLRKCVTAQYVSDLKEKWIFQSDENSRFLSSRHYLSRLVELEVAQKLKIEQWTIEDLELKGGKFDIEAKANTENRAVFEVKYLAQREVVFELNMKSCGTSAFAWLGVYSPIDYLIFRIYEAAKKLESVKSRRIAAIVLADYQLSFSIPLNEAWVDWKNPAFLRKDSEIEQFLAVQYDQILNLDVDLQDKISRLNEIRIFSINGYDLQLRHCFSL